MKQKPLWFVERKIYIAKEEVFLILDKEPSIKDVRIKGREGWKGGGRGSAKCRQLRKGGRGVGEMRMSAF